MFAQTGGMSNPPPGGKLNTRRPFRAKDAVAAGLSRRSLLSPSFRRIIRGVFIDASEKPDPWHDALAIMLVTGNDAFVSHHTAARLLGGVVPASSDLHASIRCDQHRSRTAGIRVHRSTRTPVRFRGVRTTSPVDTFLDLAAHLDLVDLVILGDSLVTKARTTPEALVKAATATTSYGKRVLRAARLVRAGVDSPMETRLRLLIGLAGLPEPEVNIQIRSELGELLRRIDLGYRAAKLGIEYDGRQHAESPTQYRGDILRREELSGRDWYEWTAVSDDIFKDPGGALVRLRAVMQKRGMDVPPLRDEWRRHFPGWG